MSTVKCFNPRCKRKAKFWCNCTSPETYYCEEHHLMHLKSNNKPHTSSSLFFQAIDGKKEEILQLLEQEKSKFDAIKVEIIASFNQILCDIEKALKEILKEIDSDVEKINNYFEKVNKVREVSIFDDDPVMKLLVSETDGAAEKIKENFKAISYNDIENFYNMSNEISKIIKRSSQNPLRQPLFPISSSSGQFIPHFPTILEAESLNLEIPNISPPIMMHDQFPLRELKHVPCTRFLASKLNRRNIQGEIKRKYNLISVKYNGEVFILEGGPESVQQAALELSNIIAQEKDVDIHWKWLCEDGQFEDYSPAISELIENAYSRHDQSASIYIKGMRYKVIFGNPHVQVLSNSNISRTVKRIDENQAKNGMCQENANNNDKPYVSWYWLDDDSNYKEFSHEASRQIEAAYSQKSIALVQGKDNRAFLVDATKMMQINEMTRHTRRVRRGDS